MKALEGLKEKREQIVREAVRYINVDSAIGRALYYPAYYQLWKQDLKAFYPQKGHRSYQLQASWLER